MRRESGANGAANGAKERISRAWWLDQVDLPFKLALTETTWTTKTNENGGIVQIQTIKPTNFGATLAAGRMALIADAWAESSIAGLFLPEPTGGFCIRHGGKAGEAAAP